MAEKFAPTTTPDWQAAVRRRTRFYVLVAILLAVLFGFLVFQFFSRQQRLAPGELTPAVFAAQDIEIGRLLTSELLDVRNVSVRAVPDSHLSFKEGAVGKLTRYLLVKGEVILPEYGLQNTDCFRETVDIGIGLEYTTNTLRIDHPPGQIQEILFIGISPIPILIATLIKIFGEESL